MTFQSAAPAFRAHKMVAGKVIQSRSAEPLSNDDLARAIPSIFATEAHESRSARFVPVPTITVLDALRAEGFRPFFAAQARTRVPGKAEFTKHVVRMRHASHVNERGESFEVILANANDGTAAYNLMPGFFRFVCLNGLITGDKFESVKVRHSGNAVDQVIEGTYRVLDSACDVQEQVDSFRALTLNRDEQVAFADAARLIRWEPETDAETGEEKPCPVTAQALLSARRNEDRASDLWTTFNRVQENVIRGGVAGMGTRNGRTIQARTRAVTGIDQDTALNKALWTLTETMARIKAAA